MDAPLVLKYGVSSVPSSAYGKIMFRVGSIVDGWDVSCDERGIWTSSCDCTNGSPWKPGHLMPCEHIKDAYLFHLHTENRKRKMQEAVQRRVAERSKEAAAAADIARVVKPTSKTGFVAKPKRRIKLEE